MKSVIVAACVALMLSGCVTMGNEKMKGQTQESVASKITEGKTTKAEVVAAYGDAAAVSFTDSGNEIWSYSYTRAVPTAQTFIPIVGLFAAGANTTTTGLVVLFDRNGIVSKYTMRETQGVMKRGIAQ
jgi:hypothetical protein